MLLEDITTSPKTSTQLTYVDVLGLLVSLAKHFL